MTGTTLRSEPRRRSRGRHRSAWSPKRLSDLRAWYDAELGQPKYSGDAAYIELSGVSTDNIYTVDSPNIDIAGDIEVIMRVNVTDWTAAANQTLVGKYLTTGNQRSWRFYISTAGAIGLTASANGIAVTTVTVTPTVPFVDGTWYWLRLRLDLSNGANSVGTVDYAADTGSNTDVPTVWTTNGSNTGATIASVFNGTGSLEIGTFTNGTLERLTGRVGRVIVNDGFSGPAVADFNASECYGPGYTAGLPVAADGSKYVQLYGRSTDYIYAADSPQFDITGDIELVARVAMEDWTPAANVRIISRMDSGADRSFSLLLLTTGALYVETSEDGTAGTVRASGSSTVNFSSTPPGTAMWLKMEMDVDDGAGNRVYRFYTAPDQIDEPTSWTQLGATLTVIGATSIYAGARPIEIGSRASGALDRMTGKVFRAIVRDGIGGTTVADYDAQNADGIGFEDAHGNVWVHNNRKTTTWTLGLPKIYDRSGNNVAPATFGSGSNQPKWLPWTGRAQVYLPGGTTNYVDCPDSVGVSVTGDITLTVQVTLDDWASSTYRSVLSKYGTQTCWLLQIVSGVVRVYFNAGSGPTNRDLAHGITGYGTWWIRVSREQSSGVVSYWKSADGITWTALGSHGTPVNAGAALTDSNTAIVLGKYGNGGGSSAGSDANEIIGHHRALVQSGLPSTTLTTVADFNAELCGQSGYTDAYGNVWTVNRATTGRKTVVQSPAARSARSVILHGTDDWIDVPAAAIPPMTAADTASATTVYRAFGDQDASYAVVLAMGGYNSGSPGMTLRVRNTALSRHILYASDGLGANPTTFGPVLPDLSKRLVSTATIAPTTLRERTNGTAGTATAITLADRTPSAAAVIGAYTGGTAYRADMEFEALVLRDAATSATEHALTTAYYRGGV